MAEAYTHIRIARTAQKLAKITITNQNAYEIGAQGPDTLFCGGFFKKTKENLPKLGGMMHNEQCGSFLIALVMCAKTPAQQSYALGFLMHYATDIEIHPYVASQNIKGEKYDMIGGHGFCEAAMDSFFHKHDYGTNITATNNTAPILNATELVQIAVLLNQSINAVYNKNIPTADYIDAIHNFRLVHKANRSKFGLRIILSRIIDKIFKTNAYIESHITPRRLPKNGFATEWINPYTKQKQQLSPEQLCIKSANRGAKYMLQARNFWQKKCTNAELFKTLGSNSYSSGVNWNLKFDDAFNLMKNEPKNDNTN